MTALTINLEKQPALGFNIESAAHDMGVTPEAFIIGLLSNFFDKRKAASPLPTRLKNLRGSLSALKAMDLSSDEKTQMILEK